MFKLNTKSDADLLLYLLSHFECDGHTVHTLSQWCLPPPLTSTVSCHCSHMHIPVHSPGLPGYIDVVQTVLVILIVAGLFPDRTRVLDPLSHYFNFKYMSRLNYNLLPFSLIVKT